MKRFSALFLVLVMLLGLVGSTPASLTALAATTPELVFEESNQDFIEYIEQSDHTTDPNGYIPPPVQYVQDYSGPIVFGITPTDTKYDPRTASPQNGNITGVRDQGADGVCWAFASIGSLESNQKLTVGAEMDLSENHMRYALSNTGSNAYGFARAVNGGGNYSMAEAYYTRGVMTGPVYETNDPYVSTTATRNASETAAKPRVGRVTGTMTIPDPASGSAGTNTNYRNQIINAISTYGAVAISYHSTANSYSSDNHEYYYPGSNSVNHGVLIVGWDNNYSKSNFNSQPAGDGAWLVKNSWGTSWGDGGYFWMSYYSAIYSAFAVTGYQNTFTDGIYEYDPFGAITGVGYKAKQVYAGNIFDCTDSNTTLQQVSFHTYTPNSNYTVHVYADDIGELSDTGLLHSAVSSPAVASGTVAYPGYTTVTLSSPLNVSGKSLAVVVKHTNTGEVSASVEMVYANYANAKTAERQSFLSSNGSAWSDISKSSQANLCIKAIVSGSNGGVDLARGAQGTGAGTTPTPGGDDDDDDDDGGGNLVVPTVPGVDVIVPSECGTASINLTQETITLPAGYSVEAYSIKGGTKWKAGALPTEDDFKKLFNKPLQLVLANQYNPKNIKEGKFTIAKKGVPTTATLITFPDIEARPKAPKLFAQYNTPDTWDLHLKGSKEKVQMGYEWAETTDKKTPSSEWKPVSASFDVISGKEKKTYLVRLYASSDGGKYTPTSKPSKVKSANFSKEPKFKINYKNETIKLKQGDCYSVGDDFFMVEEKSMELDISEYLTTGTPIRLFKTKLPKKPRSEIQTITPLPRATLVDTSLSCANGKITDNMKVFEVYDTAKEKWGNVPKAAKTTDYTIRLKATAKGSSGLAASLPGKLSVIIGTYDETKQGITKAAISTTPPLPPEE